MARKRVIDYLDQFTAALADQLEEDEKHWGDGWRELPIEELEERIFDRFDEYYFNYYEAEEPYPWLKVASRAVVAWIRENFEDWRLDE